MADLGQVEFVPLFGYFINNKTGATTTLTLNYRQNVAPNERLFSRNLLPGWNAVGVANPSYALNQKDFDGVDTNNVNNILDSLGSSVQSVYDLTANQASRYSTKISDNWASATWIDANNLDDFRETKAYAVYSNAGAVYSGYQNNNPVSTSTPVTATGTLVISKKSASPADTTIIKGSDNTILLANIRADEAVIADGLNLIYNSGQFASTTDQFENVRVYLNGALLDSFDPAASSTAPLSKTLTSSLTLNKGDNEIKVMVKAKATASVNASIFVKIDGFTAFIDQNPVYSYFGNAVSSDDIWGTAMGGVFTVQGAALATVRNDGYSANKVVVKGSTDVSLGKFALKATNDEVKVTSIALGANASSTLASSVYDAKLFVAGVQVGNTVDFGTSGATFSSLNFVIAKDTTKQIEIKASFDSSATGGFQTPITINSQDSRGTAITTGNVATSTVFSVRDAGTLNVELGGNAPQAAILAAKAAEQTVAEYKFTAVNDAATLYEINFVNTSSSTAVATSSAVDSTVAGISLYDGATLVDSTVLVNGIGRFLVNDKVVVPANGSKTLTVKVSLNAISNDATATNKDLQIALTDVKFKSSAGTLSAPQYEGDLANGFRIRKTVPTVALQALPETLLTAGDKVVSKFTVTADANGDVTLGKVVLTYATTTNSSIATIANNAVKVNGSTKDFAATVSLANKTVTVDFGATPEVITAGSSKTFEILATVSVSGNGSESVTTKIVEDAAYAIGSDTTVAGSFVWSDGADITTPTYSNGKRVPGLTTSTQTLSK